MGCGDDGVSIDVDRRIDEIPISILGCSQIPGTGVTITRSGGTVGHLYIVETPLQATRPACSALHSHIDCVLMPEDHPQEPSGQFAPNPNRANRKSKTAYDLAAETIADTTQPPPETVESSPSSSPAVEQDDTLVHNSGGAPSNDVVVANAHQGLNGQFGRYQIVRELGRGNMGTVYLARDTQLDREVALKVPHFTDENRGEEVSRFHREARAMATVRHGGICPVFDVGEVGGVHYLTMAYIQGQPLSSFTKEGQAFPGLKVAKLIYKIALALEQAHKHGIVHRDLKPANIMIDKRNEPIIMDFGLARLQSAENEVRLTQTGSMLGTPIYMSPEQVDGEQDKIDHSTDIYSLGVICYQLLCGHLPYSGTFGSLMYQIKTKTPPPFEEMGAADVDPLLAAICMKALAKRQEDRQPTAAALARELRDYLKQTDTTTKPKQGERVEPELNELLQQLDSNPKLKAALLESQQIKETPVSTTGRQSHTTQTKRWLKDRRVWGAGAAVLLFALASIVVLLRTPHGTLRVEIKDPEVEVSIQGTEITLKGTDQQELKLTAGPKILHVKWGEFGFDTKSLVLKKNATAVVVVELLDGKLSATSNGREIGSKSVGKRATATDKTSDQTPPLAKAPFDAATAKKHQQAWADYLGVPVEKELQLPGGVKLPMMLIPPGEFLMGTSEEDQARLLKLARTDNDQWSIDHISHEGPQHPVRITKPIWLSRHEVTLAQFRQFVNATGYKTDAERDGKGGSGFVDRKWVQGPEFVWHRDIGFPQSENHPVLNISWNDATAFCQWLSQEQPGWTFRLPTEAQWEYACRAGTTTDWSCGARAADLQKFSWSHPSADTKSHPVGQLLPNQFGLYDMHGNAYEWCADRYAPDYYATSPENDPAGSTTAWHGHRVRRGGAWNSNASQCRSAARHSDSAVTRGHHIGFRLAANLTAPSKKVNGANPRTQLSERDTQGDATTGSKSGIPSSAAWKPTPEHEQFVTRVANLMSEQKIDAVRERLKLLNPAFDGKLKHKIENDHIVELRFITDEVTDISPVRALIHLRLLDITGSAEGKGKLADLSALRGMPLNTLRCFFNQVASLSPLQGMRLEHLNCSYSRVDDLSPLQGMPLTFLGCGYTRVSNLSSLMRMPLAFLFCAGSPIEDLAPLKGTPLTVLECGGTRVSSLAPLEGLPLTSLRCAGTLVSDLSPLRGMHLTILICDNTNVTDLSPLREMPLTQIFCDSTRVSDLSPLRGMPLKTVSFSRTRVSDLSPLEGMKLTGVSFRSTEVSDLSPLSGMMLKFLVCDFTQVASLSDLNGMPLDALLCDSRLYDTAQEKLLKSLPLTRLADIPPADFWKQQLARRDAAEAFVGTVSKLSNEQQIEMVDSRMAELARKRSPTSAAKLKTETSGEDVIAATLSLTNHTHDVTPLMAFTGLKRLTITGGAAYTDLSPLTRLPLEDLTCPAAMARKNAPVLKEIKTLKTINGQPAAEFWKPQATNK